MGQNFAKNGVSGAFLQKQPYNTARADLLLVIAFSVLNIVLLVTQAGTYFLFSASVPYILVDLGMLFTGMYPPEAYETVYEGLPIFPPAIFYVLLGMAIFILCLYLLAYIFSSKNRVGWLIFALVLFSLDTLTLLLYADLLGALVDLAFHVIVIVVLANGIRGHYKEKAYAVDGGADYVADPGEPLVLDERAPAPQKADTLPLRAADMTVKSRTLLAFEAHGHAVVYRRVGKTNELVVDGYVYDEYVARLERGHTLTAVIDGHEICAGFDGFAASRGAVDGVLVAREVRLV